jgi:radical SAM superfamily enzyme YgiQ (UPF0313 family)
MKAQKTPKVLFIYPKTPSTFWNFKHILKFISRRAAFPPLGLLTVASILPSEWDKRLVDLNVSELSDADIAWADLVLVSAMIIQRSSAEQVIARCHAQGKTILAGGPLFTAQPEKFPTVDHIFLGEAENTLPKFVADWYSGQAEKIYRSSDWPDIAESPAPLWSLINLDDYVTPTVQFSRGCPYDCEFCDIVILNGRNPRTKSAEQFINELEQLYQAGWRGSVFIADDNLIGNKKQIKLMLRALVAWQKERRYPFRFLTQASVNLGADEELLGLMSAANFFKVFLGIETPNSSSLEECGKTQNLKNDPVAAVRNINRHGMQVMGGFIIGFDNDPEDIFEQQKAFIESIGVIVAMVGLLTALPGTLLYNRLKDENRLIADSTGGNTDAFLNFIPKMNKEELIAKYRTLIKTLYSAKSYYKRINSFLRDYRPSVRGGRLSWRDIKAFLKSLVFIGIFSRSALYYWRLLIKTIILKPKALSMAVELAIQGHHFRKMSLDL